MATTKATIDINVTGQADLDRLQNSMNRLNGVFSKFRSVIAGAAFASFARGALQMADAVQDLADVTGIASNRILAFQAAVQSGGGSAEAASKGLLSFYQSITDAADGGIRAQAAFSTLGISLKDLAGLSESDLFQKTVTALAEMPQSAQKTTLQAELLGKAFRGITIDRKFVDDLAAGQGQAAKLSQTIQRAAELNDAWEKSFFQIRLAFLEAFTPVITGLGRLLEIMPNLVTAFKLLGAAIAVALAVSGIRAVVGVLGMVGRGLSILTTGFTKLGGIFRSVFTGSTQNLGKLRDLMSALVAPLAAVAAYFGFFGNETQKATDQTDKNTTSTDQNSDAQAAAADAHRQVVSAIAEKIRNLQNQTRAFQDQNNQTIDAINLENQLIGKSKEYSDTIRAQEDLYKRTADQVQALTDAKANLSAEEKQLGLGAEYDKQIAKIKELAAAESDRLQRAIANANKLQQAEQFRLFGVKSQIDLQKQLTDLQDQSARMGLSEIENKYYDISAAARDSARAAIEAEQARRGSSLSTDEIKAYYAAASAGSARLATQTKTLYDQSRTFAAGWKKAFVDYKDNATNAAAAAARVFDKFTSGLEDAIVGFAKTGKFEWKNFVADMAEELLRSQIKQTIAGLGSALGLGNLFGGSAGGSGAGQTPNSPMYVQIVGGGAGGVLGNLGTAMGQGSATGNIGGGIWDTIKSVGSSIGDFFGGFFANGGNLGAGKWGIAGEAGPELISGPASITPMNGGSGGVTQVTYNINAVDARSFQQLLAQDPSLIFALTEQGRKSFAGGR